MSIILLTALIAFALAFTLGIALGFFKQFFAVPEDPTVTRIAAVLPGVNCGVCGFPGCDGYAAAVAVGKAPPNACTIGGAALAEFIASLTGVESGKVVETVVILACQGSSQCAPVKGTYTGLYDCRGAKLAGGTKLCSWSCQGFGDCLKVCKFNALKMGKNGLPIVDYARCVGCNLCMAECPQGLFISAPREERGARVLCSNRDSVKQRAAKSCQVACMKCGLCVRSCPEKCIVLENNLPVIDMEKCIACGVCAEKCPRKVFRITLNKSYLIVLTKRHGED